MEIKLENTTEKDYEDYYSHKCEKSDIYWNGFKSAPDKEGLKKAFLSRLTEGVWLNNSASKKLIYKITVDGKYAGYIQYTINEFDTEIGIGVKEQFASKGIGRAAVLLAIDKLRENDIDNIFVRIRDDNEASQRMFLKAGFIKTNVIEEEEFYPIKEPIALRRYCI